MFADILLEREELQCICNFVHDRDVNVMKPFSSLHLTAQAFRIVGCMDGI